MKYLFWFNFLIVQLIARSMMIIGWVLLIVPCVMKAWEPVEQIYQPKWAKDDDLPKKTIYVWRWQWLNKVWGNDEDGVVSGLRNFKEYNPNATRWKAYLWSAWRNSANNLRFIFRFELGPFYQWQNKAKTWYFHFGWYSNGFPVISAGRM